MKRIIFLGMSVSCFFLSVVGQDDRGAAAKDPNQLGSCINVTSKLSNAMNTGAIVNGLVTLWTLDEVKLVARVKEQTVNGRKTRVRESWGVTDLAGNPVTFDESTRSRRRGDKTFFQRLIYTRGTNPEGCFVVEQKEQN